MTRTRTVAATLALGLLLSLCACSSDGSAAPVDAATSPVDGPHVDSAVTGEDLAEMRDAATSTAVEPRRAGTAGTIIGLDASCQEFVALMADIDAVAGGDSAGLEAAHLRATTGMQTAPNETYRLFDMASRYTLELLDGPGSDATAAALASATVDAAATCAAVGVDLSAG